MKRTFTVKYWESYLPTTRHRIPRRRECERQVEVEIPELTLAEAPVAIRATCRLDRPTNYHYHEGALFVPQRQTPYRGFNKPERKRRRFMTAKDLSWYQSYRRQSFDEAVAELRQHMARLRIIDGILCQQVGEPMYVVMTFGLGHNHGGTALMTDNHFNPNISTGRYFRADQEAEARAEAIRIATQRGDTNDLPGLRRRSYERFKVLIPEAVKMQYSDRKGDVDNFTQRLDAISESGLPPIVAGFAVLGLLAQELNH